MTMPNMTGDKMAVELMKVRPDIPVILCTGYSKKISDEIAAEIGIKAFAYKPVVKADLAKTVRKFWMKPKATLNLDCSILPLQRFIPRKYAVRSLPNE
jgi:CheY-like chemotaxis protein